MKTRAIILLLAALPIGACRVDDMTSVQVAAVCLPPDDVAACTFAGDCGKTEWIGVTRLDRRISSRLHLIVQANNQLTNNADTSAGRGNSHDAYVTDMEVEYDAPVSIPPWRAPIGPYHVPANGNSAISMFPIDFATPGALSASAAIANAVPANGQYRLVANVRLLGKYQDETTFETAEFPVAVDVCDGCLFDGLFIGSITAPSFDCDPVTTGQQHFIACPRLGQAPASVDCVD
jgi:hypothetical protein